MTIPSHHDVGDDGHAQDHNNIVDTLSSHASQLANLTSQVVGVMYLDGNNNVQIDDTTSYAMRVDLPTGNRDTAPDQISMYWGNRRTFALDAYGHLRVAAASTTSVPAIVRTTTNQTADALQIQSGTGNSLMRVDAQGNIAAANYNNTDWDSEVWGPWTNLPLASGYQAHPDFGFTPQYKVKPSGEVKLRGTISRTTGAKFTSATAIATIPTDYAPAESVYAVAGSGTGTGAMWSVRIDVGPDGIIQPRFSAGYVGTGSDNTIPNWLSLDGITWDIDPIPSGGGTTPTLPDAPTGVAVTATTDTTVSLTWVAVSGATGYTVRSGETTVGVPTTNSYTVTGLTQSTAYSFTVAAANGAGEGPRSVPVNATTTGTGPTAPGAPTGLTATSVAQTSVGLSWTAVSGASQYSIYMNGALLATQSGTTRNVTGLNAGTSYSFQVSASNATGEGPKSAALNVTTQSSGGGGGWSDTATGALLTGNLLNYNAQSVETSAAEWTYGGTWDATLGFDGTHSLKLTVASGTTGCQHGSGVAVTAGQTLRLSYRARSAGAGATADVYVDYFTASGGSHVAFDSLTDRSSPLVTLSTGQWVQVSITSVVPSGVTWAYLGSDIYGTDGTVVNVDQFYLGVTGAVGPGIPTGLTAGTITDTSVPLSWTAVSGATSYKVYRDGTLLSSPTGTSYTASGLTAGTSYSFQVSAVNSTGESAKSTALVVTTTGGSGGGPSGYTQLFSSTDPIYWQVPASPTVQSNSAAKIAKWMQTVNAGNPVFVSKGIGVDIHQATTSTTKYTVVARYSDQGGVDPGGGTWGDNPFHDKVPWDSSWPNPPGTSEDDKWAVVLDPVTSNADELWHTNFTGSALQCDFGSVTVLPSSIPVRGAPVGAGRSRLWGIITQADWDFGKANGYIPHALVFWTPWNNSGSSQYVWPAVRTDGDGGSSTTTYPWKEGDMIWLDRSLNVDGLSIPVYAQIVARTLQKYGAYNIDNGDTIGFAAVTNPTTTGLGFPSGQDWPPLNIDWNTYLKVIQGPPQS